jgi:hypothetical protein
VNKKIYLNGQAVDGKLERGDKLRVTLAKGGADNPKINALLLVEGGVENTHYESFQNYLEALHHMSEEQSSSYKQDSRNSLSSEEKKMEMMMEYVTQISHDIALDQPQSFLNKFLEIKYGLEACCMAFVLSYLIFVNIVTSVTSKIF